MDQISPFKRLSGGWMAIVARFGHVQTQVLLAFFYVLMIGPVAIVMALGGSDQLGKKKLPDGVSAWLPADSAAPDLERAKLSS